MSLTTTESCIHGFPISQCSSCRTCPHGFAAGSCSRCRAATPARARTKPVQPAVLPPAEEYAGYEIFFDPAVSGWRYRADESAPSQLSYRSAFLVRKAVDQLLTQGPEPKKAKSKTKR